MLLVRMTSGRPPRRRSGSRKYHPVLSVVQPETRTCSRLTSAHCTHTIVSKQELVLLFRELTFGSRSSAAPREPTAARRAATDRRYTRTTGAAATTAGAPHTAGGADTAMDEAVPLAGTARAVGDSAASGTAPPADTVAVGCPRRQRSLGADRRWHDVVPSASHSQQSRSRHRSGPRPRLRAWSSSPSDSPIASAPSRFPYRSSSRRTDHPNSSSARRR